MAIEFVIARGNSRNGERKPDPAMEELRLAYARGELSDEGFDERRTRLQEHE